MFSGIAECVGEVKEVRYQNSNAQIVLSCPFVSELKIDQSIAHDGVCLTVVHIENDHYTVTAIAETLKRTNLGKWKAGTVVNLERSLKVGDRLDGHIVQGHVDTTAVCTSAEDLVGSWKYHFVYEANPKHISVQKGSVCVNGVSLTVVDSLVDGFSVCIIPYTYEYTNFNQLKVGDVVNVEFDIVGKYIAKMYQSHR
ncbi:MAG: riboflavin synthase [Flavobacteriales bacterium]